MEEVASALERWFSGASRDLPWRRGRTGYSALVSELMLQQTQVQRVAPAFVRFMERFPGVEALAAAPEQEVLAAWQGLGYYRRARLLHAAAKAVVARHAGRVPQSADELKALPGVGRYTAGAIASIVFGAREPIVDGNVFRVLARLAACPGSATERRASAWAWRQAERLVQAAANPGIANEALMELGATVCTPSAPRCSACPLAARCTAHAQGKVGEYPSAKPVAERRTLHWHALVVVTARGVLLEQRTDGGLWARMWQTPTLESERALDELGVRSLCAVWGVATRVAGTFVHTTSHRLVQFVVHVPVEAAPSAGAGFARSTWVKLEELPQYPLANAMWRVLQVAGVPVNPPPSAAPSRRAATGS
ncbi:MAG: A/G-specific adenine glycosylase [Phycisphaerae bacterium]|nr:A/G-specific adenine glycosylase [Phycisphaerae bacterium]